VDPQAALRGESGRQGSAGRERSRLRGALVVAELALAVVLLAGAGLLIKSFWRLQQVDAGFTADHVLKAEFQLPASRYPVDFRRWPDFREMHAFNGALLRRAEALPGVDSIAIAGNHPLDPGFTNSFIVPGREAEARNWPEISVRRVTPGYFRTVGLNLVRGRLLRDGDTTTSAPVALINEAAAQRFFPNADPVGARIAFWGAQREVVGVVANEKFLGIDKAPPLATYVPLSQAPSANGAGVLLVRASGDPLALASAAQGAIREVDGALAVFAVEPLTDTLARSVGERRFTMLLLALFAAVALVLAAVGVHGVLSYGVTQRTREIGIRMALGARPGNVLGLIVGQGARLAAVGVALGLAGAVALTRLLAALLYGVTPTDAVTLAVVVVVLAGTAIVASYLPARRAMRVDPSVALRAE
jgi:predicted permease